MVAFWCGVILIVSLFARAGAMGKVPIRLKEVMYTLNANEHAIMSGLWKDLPHKAAHWMHKVRCAGESAPAGALHSPVFVNLHLSPLPIFSPPLAPVISAAP